MFTEQEKALMLELVNQTKLSPAQPNAIELMKVLQTIAEKCKPEVKAEEVEVVKE